MRKFHWLYPTCSQRPSSLPGWTLEQLAPLGSRECGAEPSSPPLQLFWLGGRLSCGSCPTYACTQGQRCREASLRGIRCQSLWLYLAHIPPYPNSRAGLAPKKCFCPKTMLHMSHRQTNKTISLQFLNSTCYISVDVKIWQRI